MAKCKHAVVAVTALLGIFLAIAVAVVVYRWYFAEEDVLRMSSPHGGWSAVVTKRLSGVVAPVEARLKIERPGGWSRVWLDVFLHEYDCWGDVGPETHPMRWVSDTEVHIERWRGSSAVLRCRLVDGVWALEPSANIGN